MSYKESSMLRIRRAEDRGHLDFGWLDTSHTFSFGDYHDPEHMGFRALRVINEDWIRGGGGFPPHPHRDMEILTYVLQGALRHEDNMGNGSVIRPGDVQRMTAGTGVVHSETNASKIEPVHLLQIWMFPERSGLTPSYEQKQFPDEDLRGRLRVVASRDGRDGSITIHQDARLLAAELEPDRPVEHTLAPGRHAWIQIARGAASVHGEQLRVGDGAALSEEPRVSIEALEPARILLFDLA
jgi:quercetin 2,3-dioxygenase